MVRTSLGRHFYIGEVKRFLSAVVVGLVKLRLKPPVSVTVDFLKWNEGARVIAETAKYSAIRAAFTDHAMLVHKLRIPVIVGSDSADRGHPRKAYILVTVILCSGGHDGSSFGVLRASL
ncbi:MAG: hypothetical protein ACYCUY_01960 [Acidithiobacillus sp.]